jgi:hypothetical protein
MKIKILFPVLFLLSSFTLFGQGRDYNEKYSYTVTTYSCDEPVDFVVDAHIQGSVDLLDDGRVRVNLHYNDNAKGIGQWSGKKYVWNGPIHETWIANKGETYTYTFSWNIIGQGQLSNVLWKEVIHATVNANGELTVLFFKGFAECK